MNNFRRQRLALLFASVLVARLCAGQSSETPAKSPILGLVDGQTISEDDLPPQVQGQLKPLREQEYRIRKQALDALINQKLVEAEAKKKGISPDTLLQQEVESKLAEPTEAELRAVYAVQRDQLNQQPFEDVKAQLQQTLKKAKLQEAAQEYVTSLRGQAKILILLAAPQTLVSFDPARVRGNAKARVMIVEFADSQCPYCRQVQMTLKDILAKHEGVVALAFRDMPLEKIHPLALNAPEAARCAGEQGKFWEYYDLLERGAAGIGV
jgi:thioredoxin family protein/SurA-like protein